MKKNLIFSALFESWEKTVWSLLDAAKFQDLVTPHSTILLKPNLVEALQPPITVPVHCVEAVVSYIQATLPEKNICVAEGCGAANYDTFHCFDVLGYTEMAGRKNIDLIDLNEEATVKKTDPRCLRWPEMHLPQLLDEVFLFSLPVLKAHSLAGVTLTMKNMMGCAPPKHYQQGGFWKKASFHKDIHRAVFDLNCYRTPDFTLLEGTVGMAEAHLWGPTCKPPVNRIAVSSDPVAIDAYGCMLLGRDWQDIEHIALADGVLGKAENLDVKNI